ncbi:MAG: heme-binding protein [Pseudomonadota bacterium]
MKQLDREIVEEKVRSKPSRRFSRYPVLPPDLDLGPLNPLPGKWVSGETGWNMIALPFANPAGPPFRLLLNQYKETLRFTFVDEKVPNRGITSPPRQVKDQFVVTLDYEQSIEQVQAVDEPVSGLAGAPKIAIHHEPGLFLYLTNQVDDDIDVGRLASIPHGNSVLALGTSDIIENPDTATLIKHVSGLPIGVGPDADLNASPWLAPYKKFSRALGTPFKGNVTFPGFPGFDPVRPSELLQLALQGLKVKRTTVLALDSSVQSGGVRNIPFVERQADAEKVTSTFWIHELEEPEPDGNRFVLQYLQDVSLDFLPRLDQPPGLIRWPHISINTLRKEPPRDWAKPDIGGRKD